MEKRQTNCQIYLMQKGKPILNAYKFNEIE